MKEEEAIAILVNDPNGPVSRSDYEQVFLERERLIEELRLRREDITIMNREAIEKDAEIEQLNEENAAIYAANTEHAREIERLKKDNQALDDMVPCCQDCACDHCSDGWYCGTCAVEIDTNVYDELADLRTRLEAAIEPGSVQKALKGVDVSYATDEAVKFADILVNPEINALEDGPGEVQMPVDDEQAIFTAPDYSIICAPLICCDCGLSHVVRVEHHEKEERISLSVSRLYETTWNVRAKLRGGES